MAVAALVLGIVSVVLRFVPLVGIFAALVLGILAIVLAVVGKNKQPEKKSMAIAGLVLGIIGAALGLIGLICWIAGAGALSMFGSELIDAVEQNL
jgi:hypothetical protein